MRSYHKKVWTCAITVTFILFFHTFAFAQMENIKGVQFKDGSIIYGRVIEMNINAIRIETKDGEIISRKFDDVESIIKEATAGQSIQHEPGSKVGWEVNGGRLYLDVGLQSAYLKGDTTYKTDFPYGASELEFPLNTFLLGPEMGLSYKNTQNQEKIRLNVKLLTNIDDGSGKVKDSDWIENDANFLGIPGYNNPGLDIYSKSDIKLRANVADINLIYNLWFIEQLSIGPMLGYKYQNFKYDVSDVNQVGYGLYYYTDTGSVSGNVADYEVTYHIPYFGFSSDILLGEKFQANIKLGYSPWVSASDRDDHILRYKLSEGDTDGYARFINLNANWNFLSNWFLGVGYEYMKIHTTGDQHQFFYAGPLLGITYGVDDKITSEQWLFSAMVTYRF